MKKQYKILAEKYTEVLEAGKRKPEHIPEVLQNIPEIMKDFNGFEKWFFAPGNTPYEMDYEYDPATLISCYLARIGDYNEGEGLGWGEAEDQTNEDFLNWAQEYIRSKAAKSIKKQNKKVGINLDI